MTGRLLFVAAAAAVVTAAPAAAQHTLVLSGGGARGLSHAGAIVALEELGYRPSFVAGTSMGAIVGALYAAGYTPDSIRTIISSENWLRLMSSRAIQVGPGRDARRPLLGIGFGSGRFYGGVLSAPGIDQRLIELLFDAGVRARNDFDRLPLPYRAVAADLATGAEVVPAAGDLPRIVRASMAVPGAFAPVSWGDRVLVDGGVANNLPVSIARSLRPSPVIAIDVIRPSPEIEDKGALDIAIRSLRLLIENARPDVGSTPDFLVRPGLEPGFSETAFPADERDALELARLGYEAVIAQLPPPSRPEPEARRPSDPPPARIGSLRINGADAAEERLIRRIMGGAVGEYDPERVTSGASSLYRTGLFQAVWPRLQFDDSGSDPTLVVDVTPVAGTSINGAARWNNDTDGAAWLSLRQGIPLLTPLELHLAGTIDMFGQDGSADASLFSSRLPGLVWNAGANASEYRIRVLADGDIIAQPIVRRAGGWLGAEVRGPLDLNVSVLVRSERIRGTGIDEGWATGPYFRLARAPQPDRVTGIEPLIEVDLRGGDIEYQRANIQLSRSIQAYRIRTAVLAAFAFADADAPPDAFPALDNDLAPWLRAGITERSRLAVFGADFATPILLNGHARLRLRVVARGDVTSDLGDTDSWEFGGGAGAIWPTVAGPISIGAAVGRYGDWRLNVGVGPVF